MPKKCVFFVCLFLYFHLIQNRPGLIWTAVTFSRHIEQAHKQTSMPDTFMSLFLKKHKGTRHKDFNNFCQSLKNLNTKTISPEHTGSWNYLTKPWWPLTAPYSHCTQTWQQPTKKREFGMNWVQISLYFRVVPPSDALHGFFQGMKTWEYLTNKTRLKRNNCFLMG